MSAVEQFVENANLAMRKSNNSRWFIELEFLICTGWNLFVAPKNGVDIYGRSV
jgi:hypothetical protein